MSSLRATVRRYGAAVRAMLVFTIVLGVAYPAAILAVGLSTPDRSGGSLVGDGEGRVIGSTLIGQSFTGADGTPLPEWFQSRPSAAGDDGYDAGASGGGNMGPENPDLVAAMEERRTTVAEFEGVAPEDVPVDALTASASGLDPHISPDYALLQVPRVARARGLGEDEVRSLVKRSIEPRDLGYLGEERVNVLELNIAIERLGRQ